MECYYCGAKLNGSDKCPGCGADVTIYKKMIYLSNYYYNEGLAKANVRDMSGAIESLKNSLYYNKKNYVARNLLGLIYFEIGETVSALSEWVISKNYSSEKNAADKYLRELQKNPAQLDTINQTIKKYNQALQYCQQGSEDMAIIQLKKVISLNSKMLKAHLLLALVYIKEEKYDLADKCLKSAEKIDKNNTKAMRYRKEVNSKLGEKSKHSRKEDKVSYQSGNDIIIQPTGHFRENSPMSIIVNVVIGIAIGIAITYFLIVPNIQHNSISANKVELTDANNTINTKEQTINSLEAKVEELTKQVKDAQNETASATGKLTSYSKLVEAYAAYITGDQDTAGTALQAVNQDDLDDSTKAIYASTNEAISTEMLKTMYEEGEKAYNTYDYQTAVDKLRPVVDADPTYSEGYAVYYLAQAYRKLENMNDAVLYYLKVTELYPGTERARTAQNYIDANPDALAAAQAAAGQTPEGQEDNSAQPDDNTN